MLRDHAPAEVLAIRLCRVKGVLQLQEAVPIFKVYFEESAIVTEKVLGRPSPRRGSKGSPWRRG